MYSPTEEDSWSAAADMMREGKQIQLETPLAINGGAAGLEDAKKIASLCHDFDDWMRKVKRTFDPNTVADPAGYTSAEE
jgi:hypothetical protein